MRCFAAEAQASNLVGLDARRQRKSRAETTLAEAKQISRVSFPSLAFHPPKAKPLNSSCSLGEIFDNRKKKNKSTGKEEITILVLKKKENPALNIEKGKIKVTISNQSLRMLGILCREPAKQNASLQWSVQESET